MTDQTASPPSPPSTPPLPSPRPAVPVTAIVALFLALGALALAGWNWLESREALRDLRAELGRSLTAAGQQTGEARLLAKNADDLMRQMNERVSQIEAQMTASQQQYLSLESLYKDLTQGRDERTLAEIEQILMTAAQQLQLSRNVKAAILALESADTRLQRLNKPQFTELRRAIANDLATLRALPEVDEIGVSARLEALVARHAAWPLASAQSHEAPPAREVSAATLPQEIWGELKRLVQIRRIDANEAVVLPPGQAYFLRENLRLRLLSARLALLAQDEAAYRTDLAAAADLLRRYYNTRDAGVAAALTELSRLAELDIAVKLPGIDASLAALEAYRGRL